MPAGEARHAQPVQHAQGDEQEEHPAHLLVNLHEGGPETGCSLSHVAALGFEEHLHQDDENEHGQGVEEVYETHHDVIYAATGVAGDETVDDADDHTHPRADEAHGQ